MTTQLSTPRVPELVRDTQLEATVEGTTTIHTRRTGRKGAVREERWTRIDNKILGQGGGGMVWVERKENTENNNNQQLRAVKVIRVDDTKSISESARYMRELEAVAKFSQEKYSEFFVKSYGWYRFPGWLCIAMEYCEHGDLRRYLESVGRMPEDQVKEVASQIIAGLAMMHEEGFAHQDLKPANILIKSKTPGEWWVKLCDMGLSKRAEDSSGSTTVRATPGFWAPEILGLGGRNPKAVDPTKVDMWCLGETVFQMLTGRPVFESLAELVKYHDHGFFPSDYSRWSSIMGFDAWTFIRLSMAVDPQKRLSSSQAQLSPWISNHEPSSYVTNLNGINNDAPTNQAFLLPTQASDRVSQASARWTETSQFGPDTVATAFASNMPSLPFNGGHLSTTHSLFNTTYNSGLGASNIGSSVFGSNSPSVPSWNTSNTGFGSKPASSLSLNTSNAGSLGFYGRNTVVSPSLNTSNAGSPGLFGSKGPSGLGSNVSNIGSSSQFGSKPTSHLDSSTVSFGNPKPSGMTTSLNHNNNHFQALDPIVDAEMEIL